MKTKMKKFLCLILTVVLCATVLSSCGERQKTYHYEVDESLFNVIEADGTSKFNIVRPENASQSVLDACVTLKKAILDATGVELVIKSDFEKEGYPEYQRQDCEILVGYTNRDESALASEELSKARDYAILQSGTRIAVLSADNAYANDAVAGFIENFVHDDTCTVSMQPDEKKIVLYDYPIDNFTVNGHDISEYSVVYTDALYENEAKTVANFVYENYGISLKVSKESSSSKLFDLCSLGLRYTAAEKNSAADEEELLPFEKRIVANDEGIFVCGGLFVNRSTDATDFVNEYFSESVLSECIEYNFQTESTLHENLYVRTDDTELLNEIDEKAAAYREAVVTSTSEYADLGEDYDGTIYYISNDGSDSNDGLSPNTAWASIDKINSTGFRPNDVVLFRRGDEFRGKIETSDGVTYSAYGKGSKPIINGSRCNFANSAFWEKTDVENVYCCTVSVANVGNIVFDYSGIIGNYDEQIGTLRLTDLDGFEDYHDLTEDLEFWSNLVSDKLYLYSADGNPGDRFDSIEICEQGNLFTGSAANVTVDNLTLLFTGSHGVGSGTVENRTVTNCIFAWIGGSVLKGYNNTNTTRYGNAVEVYGGCDGFCVSNNWIYQIYDTGITHQYSTDDQVIVMKNIEYDRNIIELCHWSIEYYNRGKMPGSLLADVHVHDNIVLNGCYGWGSVGRENGGAMYNSFEIVDDVTNYVVENNIYAYSKGNVVRYNAGGDEKITFRHNTYVQYYDRLFGYVLGNYERYDARAVSILTDTFREEDPVIVFLMHDEEREAEEAAKKAEAASALGE